MLPGPRLPRRAALALGAAGLVAVAGCESDGTSEPDPPPTTPEPDADQELVDRTVASITAVWRLTGDRPSLAAVHLAHVEALGGEIDVTPVRRAVDADALRRREDALQRELVRAAMTAESGALARLLASMSAAVSQQLVVL